MSDVSLPDDRLPLTSQDLNAERIAALKELFPDAVTEGKIDFERLKESLGENVASGKERYELSWAGKSESKRGFAVAFDGDVGANARGVGGVRYVGEPDYRRG